MLVCILFTLLYLSASHGWCKLPEIDLLWHHHYCLQCESTLHLFAHVYTSWLLLFTCSTLSASCRRDKLRNRCTLTPSLLFAVWMNFLNSPETFFAFIVCSCLPFVNPWDKWKFIYYDAYIIVWREVLTFWIILTPVYNCLHVFIIVYMLIKSSDK